MDSDLDSAEILRMLMARMGEAAPEPRLGPTRRALRLLGDPQERFPFIHVTGTNGKTSTSRMAAELLVCHGMRVGLFTSPHLTRFAERIRVNGVPASDDALRRAWRTVEPALRDVDGELQSRGEPPLTFFEALTVLAFQRFALAEVDAAVIEVGMGGEWDSTNVADGRVAVFTPIALDHIRQLGSTVDEIARTKSGIIKAGAITVTAKQDDFVLARLAAKASSMGSELFVEGRHFGASPLSRTSGGQLISLQRLDGSTMRGTALNLHGAHQASNAALAVAAVDAFLRPESMTARTVSRALSQSTSPGRLQVVSRDPLVIVDAAHNPASALSLAAAVRDWPQVDRVAIVLGALEEKDAVGIIDALSPITSRFYATQSDSTRAVDHRALAQVLRTTTPRTPVHDMADPVEAVFAAVDWARSEPQSAVVVTGSITLIGEVLARVFGE